MLIAVLIIGIFLGIGFFLKTKQNCDDIDEFGVYRDANGTQRFIYAEDRKSSQSRRFGSHPPCAYSTNIYGEEIIKNINNGEILCNCDLERAKRNRNKAIKNGDAFFLRVSNKTSKFGGVYCLKDNRKLYLQGQRYCHINGYYKEPCVIQDGKYIFSRVFVKRKIECFRFSELINKYNIQEYDGTFFMDVNFNFVSPCPETIKKDRESYGNDALQIEQLIIKCINEKISQQKTGGFDKYIHSMPLYDNLPCILGESKHIRYAHDSIVNMR